jgi:endo-1,4-beta-xylanase
LTREEAIDIMNEYIAEVISRYGNRVAEWVVVNEPIAWDGSGLMNNVWKNKIGADYVELAFRKADELAPDAILILNEFGANYLEENRFNTREETFYNYVRELVEKGVPIDAVGFEFHLSVPEESWKTEPTISKIVENFKRYGELGLGVYVTELDVRIKEPLTPEKLEAQAQVYAMVMEAVLMSQYSRSITVWGHTDRYSWINDPGRFLGYSSACLFDESIEPKPAYYAVIDVMKKYLD